MKTNDVYDLIEEKLNGVLTPMKISRNRYTGVSPEYVVVTLTDSTPTTPSSDVSVIVQVFGSSAIGKSVRLLEDRADSIEKVLDEAVISNEKQTIYVLKMLRQFINADELGGIQIVELQFTARAYERKE